MVFPIISNLIFSQHGIVLALVLAVELLDDDSASGFGQRSANALRLPDASSLMQSPPATQEQANITLEVSHYSQEKEPKDAI